MLFNRGFHVCDVVIVHVEGPDVHAPRPEQAFDIVRKNSVAAKADQGFFGFEPVAPVIKPILLQTHNGNVINFTLMVNSRRFWLMKSEPYVFSITDLEASPGKTARWDGVRNFQARNFLRDQIKKGDGVLFYHSSVSPPGIAGEAVVEREGYPDPTAFDRKSEYHDPKSVAEKPTWYSVNVRFVRRCRELITLDRLKTLPALSEMLVLRRGSRLSVQPVTDAEWQAVLRLREWHR